MLSNIFIGFTAWCSLREPVQVFEFLEQLYGTFDKIADEYNVYKVETVGDCYGKLNFLVDNNTWHITN